MQNPYVNELAFYLGNAYPSFVYKINPDPIKDFIPVFISHMVEREEFEEKLAFLKNNNYRTITVNEFYSFIKGEASISQPTVCLTFDDGHKSLYKTAFPLLQKYNLKATAFIVPVFIGNPGWVTWDEITEMNKKGVIEFQSHTLEHKRIFTDNKVIDYNHTGLFKNELGLDKPAIILNGTETKDIPIGHPIYKMDSRMSDKLRYLENNKWETPEQQSNAILVDLTQSKIILEEKLNKPVQHLAYPWGIGSVLSQQLSRQAGYLTNFWGPVRGMPCNKAGGNPYKLVRLKDDYIFRLPGTKRKSLIAIFTLKLRRRNTARQYGGDIY